MPSLRWTLIAGRAQILLLFVAGFCVQARAADICDPSVLPSEIQTKLEKNYPDWQPEKIEKSDFPVGLFYFTKQGAAPDCSAA